MDYSIFLDESGNTGEPRYKDGKWNWGEQPNFALGSICIPTERENELRTSIIEILRQFDDKLGTPENEWKSKQKYTFNNDLMKKILEVLQSVETKIYIDISNKKFKIVCYMVEYCIFPYYIRGNIAGNRDNRVEMANILYRELDDSIIEEFSEICHLDISDDFVYNRFKNYIRVLQVYLNSKKLKIDLSDVIEYVDNYEKFGSTRKNLLPIQDVTNKKKNIHCFLPNIDAFTNIITSTVASRIKKSDKLVIYHDIQTQFSDSIELWTEKIGEITKLNSIENIEFIKSEEDILIQVADYLVGNIIRIYQRCLTSTNIKRNDRDLMKIVKPLIIGNCNVVSTRSDQLQFFKQFDLHPVKTPIWVR